MTPTRNPDLRLAQRVACLLLAHGQTTAGTRVAVEVGQGPGRSLTLAAGSAVAAYGSFLDMPWRALPVPIAVGMPVRAFPGCRSPTAPEGGRAPSRPACWWAP